MPPKPKNAPATTRKARAARPDRRGAEPKYLDPLVRSSLVRAFRRGLPTHLAAALAGLSVVTVRKWLEVGAKDLEADDMTPLAELVRDVYAAEARHAEAALAHVNRAGRAEWRAAAWALERRHGFAATSRVDVSTEGGGDQGVRVDVDLSALSVAQLRALAYDDEDGDRDKS